MYIVIKVHAVVLLFTSNHDNMFIPYANVVISRKGV